MTPAALNALKNGDMENLIAASTPGGIEAQEARGQKDLCRSQRLPIDGMREARPILESFGFKFGKKVDDIFIEATFPEGWSLKETDHSMWSHLVDNKGRKRAGIFYKAAFYDRSANINLSCRYSFDTWRSVAARGVTEVAVMDGEEVVKSFGLAANFTERSKLGEEAKAWLNDNFPEWTSPGAYWD